MGERLDDLGNTAKRAGVLVLDSSAGTIGGILVAAWPLLMIGFAVGLAVRIVAIPFSVFRKEGEQ